MLFAQVRSVRTSPLGNNISNVLSMVRAYVCLHSEIGDVSYAYAYDLEVNGREVK